MDIDLNLLGPYAFHLQQARNQKTARADPQPTQPSTTRRANFTALYKKQNIKFMQDQSTKVQGRQQKMEEHRKGRRSQIIADGRKPRIMEMTNDFNILIREDSSNEISELECSEASSQSIIGKQKKDTSNMDVDSSGLDNEVNQAYNTNQNAVVSDKTATGPKDPTVKTNNSKNVSKQNQNRKPTPPPIVKESRRDQLQRWKKEKEAADMKAKQVQKRPFKVGAPVPPADKPMKSSSATSVKVASQNASSVLGGPKNSTSVTGSKTGVAAARQIPGPASSRVAPPAGRGTQLSGVSKTTTKPTTAPPVSKQDEARRVTRAMSKTTTPPINGVSSKTLKTASVVGINKPPVEKMKTLKISEKPTSSKPGSAPVSAKGSTATLGKSTKASNRPATTSTAAGVLKTGTNVPVTLKDKAKKVEGNVEAKPVPRKEKSPSPPTVPQEQPQAPVVKKKKVKPKAIDTIYTDYNGRFSDACRKLGEIAKDWKVILELEEQRQGISEDIRDEIYSALGKVKLLLDSKLPQFGELLYAYLCKDEDATVILACDLEGWWDVAFIQVEAVYKIFDGLNTLKNNQWSKPEPVSSLKPKPSASAEGELAISQSEKNSFIAPPPQRRPTKPKAAASQGLKAFLASRRKVAPSNVESDTTHAQPDAEQAMDISIPSTASTIADQPTTPTNAQIPILKTTPAKADELNQSTRMFEGGFFSISSPVATPTTPREGRRKRNSVASVPATFRTPNRLHRLSSVSSENTMRRASLTMFRLSQSNAKIGVKVFAEVEDENGTDIL